MKSTCRLVRRITSFSNILIIRITQPAKFKSALNTRHMITAAIPLNRSTASFPGTFFTQLSDCFLTRSLFPTLEFRVLSVVVLATSKASVPSDIVDYTYSEEARCAAEDWAIGARGVELA
jgi:hypothetical protein